MKKSLGIAGFGNFGRFIYRHLEEHFNISVCNTSTHRDGLDAVLRSDIIILCIPVAPLEKFLKEIKGRINPEALVVDVASVKSMPAALMKKHLKNQLLGTHLLFGPESARDGIKALPVIFCPIRMTRKKEAQAMKFLTDRLGVRVIRMTAKEHDRQMAYVQGISHFIARAMDGMRIPRLQETTKSFSKLLEMKQILKNTTPALFDTIENCNPYAAAARRSFMTELSKQEKKLRRIRQ